MLKYLVVIFALFINLHATTLLKRNYYVNSNSVKLSDIVPNVKNDKIIYTFAQGKHTRRVKVSQLKKVLLSNGIKEFTSKYPYVRFTQNSPIDTSKIKTFIKEYYKDHYNSINIKNITIHPRGYTQKIPKEYTIKMQSKNYLRASGIVIIKSMKRDSFFSYDINAKVSAYIARKDIKRNIELSMINTRKMTIALEGFRAMPIQKMTKSTIQSKHNIKKGKILTSRDITKLYLVRRGSSINVFLDNSNLTISFSAKAMQNGCLGDTISVIKSNGKKIKVIVTARRIAEVR